MCGSVRLADRTSRRRARTPDRVAVVRGNVVLQDGSPLVGVNISFLQHPEYGYTISRQDGSFDLLTSGAASMTLMFQRPPFLPQTRPIWTPHNNFLVLDQVTMSREEAAPARCDVKMGLSPYPLVLPAPLPRYTGACAERGPVIPELQAVQEEVPIPGSFVRLSYLSMRAGGYMSLLRVLLTPAAPSAPVSPLGSLAKVHVRTSVQGRLYQRWYPAGPGLVHRMVWNKTDVYGQPVWGLTHATAHSPQPIPTSSSLISPPPCPSVLTPGLRPSRLPSPPSSLTRSLAPPSSPAPSGPTLFPCKAVLP
ncbi:unnamed protein product [Boreogadus saida]